VAGRGGGGGYGGGKPASIPGGCHPELWGCRRAAGLALNLFLSRFITASDTMTSMTGEQMDSELGSRGLDFKISECDIHHTFGKDN
jgi:hypothetical protein